MIRELHEVPKWVADKLYGTTEPVQLTGTVWATLTCETRRVVAWTTMYGDDAPLDPATL